MNEAFAIPNGNDTITVELTIKEAMALSSGVRFRPESKVALNAKRKLRKQLDSTLLPHGDRIPYHSLEA